MNAGTTHPCEPYLLAEALTKAAASAWSEGWQAAGEVTWYADVFLAPADEVNPYLAGQSEDAL